MKKHLVMICGFYYPQPSATATCAERYLSLFRDEYDIDIISYTEDGNGYELIDASGYSLHVLTNKRLMLEGRLKGVAKTIVHKLGSALLYTSFLGNQNWFSKAVTSKLTEIHRKCSIDVVFSICSPFAAHVGAAKFCSLHSNIKSVAYTVDPYTTTDRIRPIGRSFKDLLDYECYWLNQFQSVLLSEEVFDNRSDLTSRIHYCKTLPYMLPPVIEDEVITEKASDGKIHCVYAGSFYDEIRNPMFMLQVFSLLQDKNIVLHLYSRGCENIINKFSTCKHIVQHGLINPSKLQTVYVNADVLVGIGNSIKEFLPSKTFEYVATRKPIVYFNYPEVDNIVLTGYPKVIQIEMKGDAQAASSILMTFLEHLDGKLVSKNMIYKSYSKYTPERIKQILETSFDSTK